MDMIVQPSSSPIASAEPVGFAAVLRERTHAIHREAERSPFIADLLRGRATRFGYATYLFSLLPAYEAMERHLAEEAPLPARRAFAAPELFRADALRSDLRALHEGDLPVLPEARAYADAIEAQSGTVGLVAHAYARYLGDLSGGQILKPLLARTLHLTPGQLAFYDFPGLDIGVCKLALRDALDTIASGSPEGDRFIDEAILAFRHTIAISAAVSALLANG